MRELIICGPPGCGKTTELAHRAQQAAARFGGERVMICSLTRSAAGEVAGRDTGIPDDNIGTLHSAAYRAIGSPKLVADSPKGLERWNEWIAARGKPDLRLSITGRTTDDAPAEPAGLRETRGDRAFGRMSALRARCVPECSWDSGAREFAPWWRSFMDESAGVDFHGMIERACREADRAPGDPEVIFVHEAQDLTPAGIRLIRHWGRAAKFVVFVGDPLQNLYHWAGSEATAFTQSDTAGTNRSTLIQSHRVPRAVHEYALRWIGPLKRELESTWGAPMDYPPRDHEGEVRLQRASTYRDPEPILRLVEEYQARGKKVMIQASCAYILEPTIQLLRQAGMPFHNPWRRTEGRWNPLARGERVNPVDCVLRFLRLCPSTHDQPQLWSAADVWAWAEWAEATGLIKHGKKQVIHQYATDPLLAHREVGCSSGSRRSRSGQRYRRRKPVILTG